MAIFDHSWYGRVIEDRVEAVVSAEKWRKAYADINSLERTLAVDRYLFAKFFIHIDRKTQKKRFKKLEDNPLTEWQVDEEDWNQNKKYDQYLLAVEEMLERTETEWAPWILVEGTNHRWARVKVLRELTKIMEDGLKARGLELPPVLVPPPPKQETEEEHPETGTQENAENS
jgi:polyphosphate kinase 2 (PPK2 family)